VRFLSKSIIAVLLASIVSLFVPARAGAKSENNAYLFTSFEGNGERGLQFLYSEDGYSWARIPGYFLRPEAGPSRLMRDPSLLRGPDGTFHLVWTTGWKNDQGFGYASSKDLRNWSKQRFMPVMAHEPTTVNVWAPELFYDETNQRFVVIWASTIPGRFANGLGPYNNNQRMYYTTTRDFETLAPTKLFFDPGFSVIDCTIVPSAGGYVLVLKDNSRPQMNLRVAFGKTPLGPWHHISESFTQKFTEGPSVLKIGDDFLIYFDAYRKGTYGASKTRDFKSFVDATSQVSFPPGHKHGTALQVSRSVVDHLRQPRG
jgi:alpha-L-fucosidase